MRPSSLLLPIFFVLATVLAETVTVRRDVGLYEPGLDAPHHTPRAQSTTADDTLEVLNVVLVASVDGKFHALNRTNGGKLWSMPSSPPSSAHNSSVPSILEPLISTKHLDADPDLEDDSFPHETYIVEPQSGDIYVTSSSSPTAPLQRLPLSMTQLVDLSPFSFGEADDRVFVGSKKTSILLLELETGRVKAALDAECPWDVWHDFAEQDVMDIDLDELEGIKPSRLYPSEIFIGRTDYRVSIMTRPSSPSSQPPPVQHLSFSTYGPNNQDLERQAAYRRSVDDLYVEPLPNGEVISFKSTGDTSPTSLRDNQPVWGQKFSNPIVAIFDVVKSARRTSPFVLLQPRLHLQDIIPHQREYPNDETAFVGLVPETGSLFALGPDNFPLVAFSGPVSAQKVEGIEGTSDEGVLISHEDSRLQCYEGTIDRRCQTGVRALRADSASRIARLLDGVPSPGAPPLPSATGGDGGRPGNTNSQAYPGDEQFIFGKEEVRATVPWQWISIVPESLVLGRAPSGPALLLTLASMVGTVLWFFKRKPLQKAHVAALPLAEIPVLDEGDKEATPNPEPTNNLTQILHSESPAQSAVAVAPAETPHISSEPLIPTLTAEAPPTTDDDDKPSLVKAEPAEGAEDAGEVKKKPRKRRRRRRGEAKDAAADGGDEPENEDGEGGEGDIAAVSGAPSLVPPPTPVPQASTSLIVSDTVLGYGSHGTVVYQGSLQGRAVAVKRLLRDFVTLAHREVSLLKDADDHPNVIRYYYQEAHENFLFIALELCPASLADIIERPDQFRDIAIPFNPKRALRQITSGLRHLHALKIVHRDIKPQNILISGGKKGESNGHRMLISDFGLCRKLELDQTSFLPTTGGAMGVGTFGWRAPEILRGEVKLDEPLADDNNSQSSRGSVGTATGSNHGKPTTRLTKSVDIFALGCLYYYCQTNGGHPFGDRYEREVNIIRDQKSLQGLEGFGEEGSEAVDLINAMLAPEAADRPDTTTCLMHPYFWDSGRRLGFLQDASDRFEIMCRDPRDPHLVLLENNAINVVGPDWPSRLDKIFVENLGKFRKYDGRSVQDLLRALRNKKHHYQDLPENVRRHVGSMPEGYLSYFTRRYPRLFLHVHAVIASSSLRQESMFRSYFDLTD